MIDRKIVDETSIIEEDKVFALRLANHLSLPIDKIEHAIIYLRQKLNDRMNYMKLDVIDYKEKATSRESRRINWISQWILGHIYYYIDINIYRKCIMAGLVLMHFKLDKYSRIMTDKEYDANLKIEALNYNAYLYNRMKSRFKRFNKEEISNMDLVIRFQ